MAVVRSWRDPTRRPPGASTRRPVGLATRVDPGAASARRSPSRPRPRRRRRRPATPSPTDPAAAPRPDRRARRGDPRLAYAEFLLRVNDDRPTVEKLNRALSSAAQAQDPTAVRRAAVAILDFVDGERDWLREHPPADCYAAAHAAAGAMLDAYGAAADRFIAWAATGGGLGGPPSARRGARCREAAGDALTAFGSGARGDACPA